MSEPEPKQRRWVLIDCPYCGGTHEMVALNGAQLFACKLVPRNGPHFSYAEGLLDIREVT